MRRLWLTLSAVLAIGASAAQAQTYPNKTVRIVVPYGPGGGVSLLAQQVGQKMQELMKQPVIVDNRPGAGGNVGADLVAKSAPDFSCASSASFSPASGPRAAPSRPAPR